jgi:hypothetical protein
MFPFASLIERPSHGLLSRFAQNTSCRFEAGGCERLGSALVRVTSCDFVDCALGNSSDTIHEITRNLTKEQKTGILSKALLSDLLGYRSAHRTYVPAGKSRKMNL